MFYAKVNLAKDGKVTQFKDDSLYYVRSEIPRDSATVGKVNLDSTDNSYNTNYNTTVLTNNEGNYCSSEPVSCAAIEQDCTLGLARQIFNDSYDVGVDVVFPRSCQ